MATPDVTVDIADFVSGSAPASKVGYKVSLIPIPDVAPYWRSGYTNASGVTTLSEVVPGTYRLQICGLGVADRTVTVTDESGPLDASELTVGASAEEAVPSENNPLISGDNITFTQTPEGLEIAAASGGGEGTATGDVAFTETEGTLSIESDVADGASAVAFSHDTTNNLTTAGAILDRWTSAEDVVIAFDGLGGMLNGRSAETYWGGPSEGGIVVVRDAALDEDAAFIELANVDGVSLNNYVGITAGETLARIDITGKIVLNPTAADGSAIAVIGSKTAHTSGNLAEVKNDTSVIAAIHSTVSAGQTGLFLYDADNETLQRVTLGAADSGGSGFRALRIPNAP